MKTEFKKKLAKRYTAYISRDEKYWKYSKKGAQQINRPGDSCARYRVRARANGCNLFTRKRRRDKPDSPSRPFSDILPKENPPNGGSD